jgi:hypothetical protein
LFEIKTFDVLREDIISNETGKKRQKWKLLYLKIEERLSRAAMKHRLRENRLNKA